MRERFDTLIRSRRRNYLLASALVTALVLAGCSGRTTGATNITVQGDGSVSAALNAIGSCSQSCTAYVRWRVVGSSTWTNAQPFNVGAVTNAPWWQTATGLVAGTQYEYQACGKEASYSQFVCVGPDGGANSTQKFVATPGSTDWSQLRFGPSGLGLNPFEITINTGNAGNLTQAWHATTG